MEPLRPLEDFHTIHCDDESCTCVLHRLFEPDAGDLTRNIQARFRVQLAELRFPHDGKMVPIKACHYVVVVKQLLFILVIPVFTTDHEEVKRKCGKYVLAATAGIDGQGRMVLPESVRKGFRLQEGDPALISQVVLESGDLAALLRFPRLEGRRRK